MIRTLAALLVALALPSTLSAQEELVGKPPADTTSVPAEPAAVESPAAEMLVDPNAAALAERQARRARGRTNLLLGQSMHGIVLGTELVFLVAPRVEEVDAGAVLAGGGLGFLGGLLAPLLLTPDGVEPGHAAALNSGPAWGFFLGFTAARTHYGIGERGRLGIGMLSQLGGLAVGQLAWQMFEPTRAQVTLVDSVAFWSAMLGTLVLVAEADNDFPQRRPIVAGMHFWTGSVGLVGGGILAAANPGVRGERVMLINLGGVAGGVLAPFVGALTTYLSGRGAALAAMGGAAAGMGPMAFATRNMKPGPGRAPELSLQLMPGLDGGHTVGVGGQF